MDNFTLAVTLILVLAAMAGLSVVVARSGRERATTYWAFSFCGVTLGYSILLLGSSVPEWIPFFLGNALILSFHGFLYVGFSVHLKVGRPWNRRLSAYSGAWVLGMGLFVWLWPSFPGRVLVSTLWLAALSLETLVLVQAQKGRLRPQVYRLIVVLLVLGAVMYCTRSVLVFVFSAPSSMADHVLTPVLLLAGMLYGILWAGTLLILQTTTLLDRVTDDARELDRLNRLKDQVLAMTSHDLKNPLGNLQMVWGELGRRIKEGKTSLVDVELIGLVDQSLAGAQGLLANLFAFAEAQKLGPGALEPTDLVQVRSAVLDQWGPLARVKSVTLEPVAGPEYLIVQATKGAAAAVLRNLVGNAVKFTPHGGHVRVALTVEGGGQARMVVSDTGIGMTDGQLEASLKPESRSSRPGTAGERGSGFGLVLVRELVDGWGGTLGIESKPGQGTTVTVTFPRVEGSPMETDRGSA